MIVVIIAGGSGTRLWPLSTSEYPKHLLSLVNEKSLLQNTFERVSKLTSVDRIFVVSEASHADHVIDQLPGVPRENIIIEPGRRGTASCFLLALQTIRKRGLEDQATFFHWADHVIRDQAGFCATANLAGELAEDKKQMVYVGIEPTYPTTGLGYMEKGERLDQGYETAYKLARFVEKPDHNTALEYFESGRYLWNTGYLMTTLATLEREIKEHSEPLWNDYQSLLNTTDVDQTYLGLENKVIEYELAEKVQDALVVSCTFDWLDVGSFSDLYDANGTDEQGNHLRGAKIYGDEIENAYVRNEEDKPVVVIGLDNVVVVNTPNGVLVSRKDLSQKVKDAVKRMNED